MFDSGFPTPTPILTILFPSGKIHAYPAGVYSCPTINHHVSGSAFSTSASYSAPAPNLSHCVTYPIVFEIVDVNPVASITTLELNVIFSSALVPFTPMMFCSSSLITSLMLVFTKISTPNFFASSDNHR